MSVVTEQSPSDALGGEAVRLPTPGKVAPGECWAGKYQIGERVAGAAGTWYRAVETATGRDVLVHTWPLVGGVEHRRAIFEHLRTVECPHLQRPVEERVTDFELVQVWGGLPGVSLHAWRTGRAAPEMSLVVELVRQVSAMVEALHRNGLGHFGLDADWIYVHETPEGPRFSIGGVDRAEEVDQPGLIAIEADSLWAPPETAGLYKHSPGSGLLAWDWWSLGRVVQQCVTGRHAVELLPDDLKARLPHGLRGQAEALLFERATGSVRAGAVELMGRLDPRLDRLLRGLLASSAAGRWGAGEVRAWLAGELPADHYEAHRQARFFLLDERRWNVADAADRLLGPEHNERVVEHATVTSQPWTLAKFLSDSDQHDEAWKQLQAVTDLEKAPALSKVEPKLRKRLAATLGLHVLAGRTFRWRGRPVSAEALRAGLADSQNYRPLRGELIALADPSVVVQIRRHDHATAQLLEFIVKRALEAEAFLTKMGFAPAILGNPERLWLLALESEARLEAALADLKTRYAETSNATAASLLTTPHPAPAMLLVLARMAEDPPRFGFITHEEVRRRRLAQLLERDRALADVLCWRLLGRAMAAGPIVFGRRWLFAAALTGAVLLLAVHAPGPLGLLLGLGPAAAAIALRLFANRHQAGVLARAIPAAKPWGWRDSAARCDREAAQRAKEAGVPATLAAAKAEWTSLREELGSIIQPADNVHLEPGPRHLGTWAAVAAGWALAALLVAGSVRQGLRKPPSWTAHLAAWQESLAHQPSAEEVLRASKLRWPYRPSLLEAPTDVRVEGEFHPTPEQLRYALARGRQLVDPYNPTTIDALVAIYIPLEDGHGALMFFDGKKGAIQGNNGVLVAYVPFAKTWLQIGTLRALFIEK